MTADQKFDTIKFANMRELNCENKHF